ncbi:hypothetical protein [Amycolatopsis echigonensis]|uniref:TfoX N-terminal domain-containing protein n=1 Tax=Amycolatopsis echigonensis TaxID=2576905 RepID=A0A8E1W0A9_9PSEU|nr:hypothetical protein [Amycolatopsis echigonensis]MBB2501379.1 hypothetical protein [Amycolatopsis echigonensis]
MTEERFEDLVDELQLCPGVTPPRPGRGFCSHALKVHGRIFAMFVRGELVVKLPKARVDELVEGGHGVRFDANKGVPMKEWFAMDPESPLEWSAVAREAMAFVGS